MIMRNYIESSTHNGIYIDGDYCRPTIQYNILEENRKCGIFLENRAQAYIGDRATTIESQMAKSDEGEADEYEYY